MKTSNILKHLLTKACVFYSVFSILLLLISTIMRGGADQVGIGVLNVLLLFPFSLFLSIAEWIKALPQIASPIRRLLHYLIVTADLLLFLWLPSKMTKNLTVALLLLCLITVAYWIIHFICVITVKRFHSFKEE